MSSVWRPCYKLAFFQKSWRYKNGGSGSEIWLWNLWTLCSKYLWILLHRNLLFSGTVPSAFWVGQKSSWQRRELQNPDHGGNWTGIPSENEKIDISGFGHLFYPAQRLCLFISGTNNHPKRNIIIRYPSSIGHNRSSSAQLQTLRCS